MQAADQKTGFLYKMVNFPLLTFFFFIITTPTNLELFKHFFS